MDQSGDCHQGVGLDLIAFPRRLVHGRVGRVRWRRIFLDALQWPSSMPGANCLLQTKNRWASPRHDKEETTRYRRGLPLSPGQAMGGQRYRGWVVAFAERLSRHFWAEVSLTVLGAPGVTG